MKKIFALSLITVLILVSCASAEVVGILGKLNVSEEQFRKDLKENFNNDVRTSFFTNEEMSKNREYRFYDSLMMMQLALAKGEIQSISVPDCIADFMVESDNSYNIKGFIQLRYPVVLAFGFTGKNALLHHLFNQALYSMENDGTLGKLILKYVNTIGTTRPQTVSIPKIDGAKSVKVALTGDLPPIDYVAEDGTPAGFNTAVLAEISRRLKINIEIIQVEAGSRASALISGRADCSFWFEGYSKGSEITFDAPEGLIFSKPYYSWHKYFYVGK